MERHGVQMVVQDQRADHHHDRNSAAPANGAAAKPSSVVTRGRIRHASPIVLSGEHTQEMSGYDDTARWQGTALYRMETGRGKGARFQASLDLAQDQA